MVKWHSDIVVFVSVGDGPLEAPPPPGCLAQALSGFATLRMEYLRDLVLQNERPSGILTNSTGVKTFAKTKI